MNETKEEKRYEEPVLWQILNSKGHVIGMANARTKEDAIRRWNRANISAQDFATDAIERV